MLNRRYVHDSPVSKVTATGGERFMLKAAVWEFRVISRGSSTAMRGLSGPPAAAWGSSIATRGPSVLGLLLGHPAAL